MEYSLFSIITIVLILCKCASLLVLSWFAVGLPSTVLDSLCCIYTASYPGKSTVDVVLNVQVYM